MTTLADRVSNTSTALGHVDVSSTAFGHVYMEISLTSVYVKHASEYTSGKNRKNTSLKINTWSCLKTLQIRRFMLVLQVYLKLLFSIRGFLVVREAFAFTENEKELFPKLIVFFQFVIAQMQDQ